MGEPVGGGLPDGRIDRRADLPLDPSVDALVDEVGDGTQQTPGDRTAEQGSGCSWVNDLNPSRR
ncbi:hypothetical protein LV779_21720 [Streptomyces thinghirensis]|nr:hypothetical protein [Streptomyces thinghirensis]